MKLPVHIQRRPDGVRAFCPDLPGCSASAPTEDEALRKVRAWIETSFAPTRRAAPTGTRIVHIEV